MSQTVRVSGVAAVVVVVPVLLRVVFFCGDANKYCASSSSSPSLRVEQHELDLQSFQDTVRKPTRIGALQGVLDNGRQIVAVNATDATGMMLVFRVNAVHERGAEIALSQQEKLFDGKQMVHEAVFVPERLENVRVHQGGGAFQGRSQSEIVAAASRRRCCCCLRVVRETQFGAKLLL